MMWEAKKPRKFLMLWIGRSQRITSRRAPVHYVILSLISTPCVSRNKWSKKLYTRADKGCLLPTYHGLKLCLLMGIYWSTKPPTWLFEYYPPADLGVLRSFTIRASSPTPHRTMSTHRKLVAKGSRVINAADSENIGIEQCQHRCF